MLNKGIRLGLTVLFFGLSVWQFAQVNIGNGIMWLLFSGLVLLTYFRNEKILLTFWFLRKNKTERAKKILNSISKPEQSLTKGNLAYFYFLNGILESQTGIGKAETYMRKALNTGLRMDHDKAMAKLSLAGIAIAKRRKREATTLITEAKKLDKKGLMNEQIKMLKEQMKRI